MNKSTLQAIHEHLLTTLKKIEQDINFHEQMRSGFFQFANPEQESSLGNWIHGKKHGNKLASLKKKKKVLHAHIREVKKSIYRYGMIEQWTKKELDTNLHDDVSLVEQEIDDAVHEKMYASRNWNWTSFFYGGSITVAVLIAIILLIQQIVKN